MENIVTVVLIGRSFLLKAGLEAFLAEFSYVSVAASFDGTEPDLDIKVKKLKPGLVIVIPDKSGYVSKSLLISLRRDNITLMALAQNNLLDELRGKFSEVFSEKTDKMELTEIINKFLLDKGLKTAADEINHTLSGRETDILKHVAYGHTNQEIADKLFLSIHTVTTHRKNITRKLGIKTVSGLTVYALMNKLVKPSEIEKKN